MRISRRKMTLGLSLARVATLLGLDKIAFGQDSAPIWDINVSLFARGCATMKGLLDRSLANNGTFPAKSFYLLFPLQSQQRDFREQIDARGNVTFTNGRAVNSAAAPHEFRFVDDQIGNISVAVPTQLSANVTSVGQGSLSFGFQEPYASLTFFGLPSEIHLSKRFHLVGIEYSSALILLYLQTIAKKQPLTVRLQYLPILKTSSLAQEERLGFLGAFVKVASSGGSKFCCQDALCFGSDGHVTLNQDGFSIVHAFGGTGCAVMADKDINDYNSKHPDRPYTIVASGFGSYMDAMTYIRDTLKNKCP